ncbi:MAG TPA: DUF4407 domain-containing protein [Actinoplanes sp.]|nr:DUF4407 domain-containing protein [Actinoplanes sp.]
MTDTALIRQQAERDFAEAVDFWPTGGEPLLPAPPGRGPGRWLRRVAGVHEDLLDWVPQERPRYTWQGAIIVNTAVLAGLSMLVLLSRTGLPGWLLAPLALLWAFVILTFDAWLVSSTHGVTGRNKVATYLPRILISVLMGAVIAEPLLLAVFAPAIHTEVRQQRLRDIDAYEHRLRACNPVSGEAPTGCTELLNVANPLVSIRTDLTRKTELRDTLQQQVAAINAELARRENVSRAECNGTKINSSTTGVVGEGPNCRRNRREADRYRESSDLAGREADVSRLSREIAALTAEEATAGKAYAAAVHAEIAAKVADARNSQQQIGILDEDRALGTLAANSVFVAVGSWLLRLLLIVVDCLPVLTKLLTRSTTYDALLSRQADVTDRLHDKSTAGRELTFHRRVDLQMQRTEHDFARSLDELRRGR